MTDTLPRSEHFTFHELDEGVWAAIVIPSGLAASNSGIIDLGDRTLIFDTTFSPASAMDLRTTAESLTGKAVTCVLNSHWHNDHVFGNAVFNTRTEIYATARTCAIMAEKTPAEILEFKKYWPEQKSKWAELAKNANNETERLDYEDGVRFAQSIMDTFPQVQLRLPDHTFTERMEFKGSERTAEFITFGGGHTASDAFLYLPAERIIFTGDLLVVKNHPDLTHGDPHIWLDILSKIKGLEPVCLIPGHGEPAMLDDVTTLERYIHELLQMAGQGSSESAALQPPPVAAGWNNAEAFERNLKFLRENMRGE